MIQNRVKDLLKVKILANKVLFQLIIKKRLIHRTHQVFSLYPNNYHHFYQKLSIVNSIKSSQNIWMLIANAVMYTKMMFGPILMMTSSVV